MRTTRDNILATALREIQLYFFLYKYMRDKNFKEISIFYCAVQRERLKGIQNLILAHKKNKKQ